MSAAHPRKKLFVNKFFQGKTIRRVAFYWCTYHLVLWHVMFLYRYMQYRGELLAGARAQTFAALYGQFTLEHYAVIVCALAILPLVVWDVLTYTHRVVGPLARFRHCLKLLSHGEVVTQVTIRKGDFLVDLQQSLNEFLDSPYNTARWGTAPAAQSEHGAAEKNDQSWTVSDETQLLEDLREIQTSLLQPSTAEHTHQPVPVTAGAQ
jgi:hypothetical protein